MCIKIHFYLITFLVYTYAIHKLDIFMLFYMFTILHELAHILVASLLKVKIDEIILLPVGVTAKYTGRIKIKKEMLISLAGPLLSIVLAIFLKNELHKSINILIAILNLIPIYPLDGGRIIRAFIIPLAGYKKGIIICSNISKIFAIFLRDFKYNMCSIF